MKKRILMLTLVLMIVLSSFSVSSATIQTGSHTDYLNSQGLINYQTNFDYLINKYSYVLVYYTDDSSKNLRMYGFNVGDNPELFHLNGTVITAKTITNGFNFRAEIIMYSQPPNGNTNRTLSEDGSLYTYGYWDTNYDSPLLYANFPIYGTDYVDSNNKGSIIYDPTPPLNVYVKIKAGQQLNLVYDNSVRNKILKSVDTTDNVILNFWVSNDGKPSSLSAGQVADSWWKRIDIDSIPYMPELDEGEMYSIGLFGKSNNTIDLFESPTSQEATFEIDITKCQYSVTSTLTGLPIDAGTIDHNTAGPPATGGLPGLVDMDETKNGISRSDYQEGIVGDIEYQFDRLISFIKLPFTILLSFFVNLGDIIQYALGSVGALTGSLKSLYGILPASIAYLMTFAITITIFKLIFGR